MKPGHRAEAKLVIVEEEYRGTFSMETRVTGRVRAVFTNLKDNNSFLKAVEGGIVQVVQSCVNGSGGAVSIDRDTDTVVFQTRGKCTFCYGLRQDVEVDQVPLLRCDSAPGRLDSSPPGVAVYYNNRDRRAHNYAMA